MCLEFPGTNPLNRAMFFLLVSVVGYFSLQALWVAPSAHSGLLALAEKKMDEMDDRPRHS